jgi:hypothetical protein
MKLLLLLVVLGMTLMPSLAARDERMNNVGRERKFVHHMREKRFNPQPDPPIILEKK